ncbi:MAG: DHHW family protein [Oscillospiraceae bacterium]|nr:DHHW family protein [Oscillospiraceae bacterium]
MKDLHKRIMLGIFFALISLIPVISLIIMPKEKIVRSEIENKTLAVFPEFNTGNILDVSFMQGFENWANDRVMGRISWIKLKNSTERLLGKTEINGVFITEERMMQAWSGYDSEAVNKNLDAMNRFTERHSDVPVYFMLAPTALEIYRDTLPESAPVASQKDFIRHCYDYLTDITSIDVLPALEELKDHYIYYRTDHHWNPLGAYIAYAAATPVMGYTAAELNRFNIESASNSFLGTLYSKTLDSSITPDIINIYTFTESEPEVTVTVNSGNSIEEYNSLYFREALEIKNKYEIYLGLTMPIINITTDLGVSSGKKLLIFKDSFAHCLIPFLSKNFSEITVADMRFINAGYDMFFDVNEYDSVLFIYNVITFSEDRNLVKLNAGQ